MKKLVTILLFSSFVFADGDRYLNAARKAFDKKSFSDAGSYYTKAYKSASNEFTVSDFVNAATALSETKKYADAIPFYEKAIQKRFEKSNQLLYDIAVMYSNSKNEKLAQQYIRMAVNLDRSLLQTALNDKNLEFVKSQSGWSKFAESLKSVSESNYNKEDLIGIMQLDGVSNTDSVTMYFCSNDQVVQVRKLNDVDGACVNKVLTGKWTKQNGSGRVSIDFQRDCKFTGVGNQTKAKDKKSSATCDGFDYQFLVPSCNKSVEILNIAEHLIIDGRSNKKPEWPLFNNKYKITFKAMAKDPKMCDPQFKPEKEKDLIVE